MRNPQASQSRHNIQRLGFGLLTLMTLLTVTPIVMVVLYIVYQGLPAISLEFITAYPTQGMRAGGIYLPSLERCC
jgi:phosphate transport system permease protein